MNKIKAISEAYALINRLRDSQDTSVTLEQRDKALVNLVRPETGLPPEEASHVARELVAAYSEVNP